MIDKLLKPSGISEQEALKRAAEIVQRAVKNGLTEVEVFRFPNALCTDNGRAINMMEPGWENTLTGLPKEMYSFWDRHLRPIGYKIRVQVVDFSGGVPGDIAHAEMGLNKSAIEQSCSAALIGTSPRRQNAGRRGTDRQEFAMTISQVAAPVQTHANYERLIARAKQVPPATTVVVHPCDETSLRVAAEAAEAGIIIPTLVGPKASIAALARQHGIDISRFELIDAVDADEAAAQGVKLIHEAKGELLMKGSLHTDELMRAVTASATGLRTARRISHVFVMDVPTYPEPLLITDAAINIFPDLDAKRDIIQNAIDLFTQAGLGTPRVAIVSAVETVTSKIPSTIEAAALCKMAERGQITGGVLDGPLAFDNAIDPDAAKIKGIHSPVAGRAQILVVPDLEAGNMLAKNLSFLAQADAAGIVLGARVPIILTSRADSVRIRMASCAVAALYADARRRATILPAA